MNGFVCDVSCMTLPKKRDTFEIEGAHTHRCMPYLPISVPNGLQPHVRFFSAESRAGTTTGVTETNSLPPKPQPRA